MRVVLLISRSCSDILIPRLFEFIITILGEVEINHSDLVTSRSYSTARGGGGGGGGGGALFGDIDISTF